MENIEYWKKVAEELFEQLEETKKENRQLKKQIQMIKEIYEEQ